MEAGERVLVFLIGEGGIGHAGELLVEDVLVILECRIEKLVERTVVADSRGSSSSKRLMAVPPLMAKQSSLAMAGMHLTTSEAWLR